MKRNFTKPLGSSLLKRISLLSIISLFTLGATAQNVPELIYYQFNGTGSTVPNKASSPVGSANASMSGVTQASGGLNSTNALNGPGSNSNNVNTGWATNLGTGNWTIGFWFKDYTISTSLQYYFGDGSASSFRCFTGGVAGSTGLLLRGPVTDVPITGITTGPHYVCWVYDASAGNIKSYLDGVLNKTVNQGAININGSAFTVGGYSGSGSGLQNGMKMDEFRVYNRALDVAEILLTMNKELPLKEGTNNIGVDAVIPGIPCAGSNTIKAEIRNYGANQVDSVKVNWSINGVLQTPVMHYGLLDTVDGSFPTNATVTLGSHSYVMLDVDSIIAWTSEPNGGTDTVNNNDTNNLITAPALNGTFTVGGVGADYATLQAAFTDLKNFGICGPVILDCDGTQTFTGQHVMEDIAGLSSTSTIYVKGNGAKITYNSSSSNARAAVQLNGVSWVTFDNFEVTNTNSSWAYGIHILSGGNNTVKNCTVTVNDLTSTNIIPLVISGSATSYSTSTSGNNNRVEGCDLKGGYFGMTLYANGNTSSGNVLTNNKVHSFYVYGIYCIGATETELSFNDIYRSDRTGTITTFYGIYMNGNNANSVINGNTIRDAYPTSNSSNFTSRAIYLVTESGLNSSNGVRVSNNLIYNTEASGSTSNWGIYNANAYYSKIYNNTILMTRTGTTGARFAISTRFSGSEVGEEIYNNNIVVGGGTSGNKFGIDIGDNNIANPPMVDNNNVYGNGVGNTFWGTWDNIPATTLEDWNGENNDMFAANKEIDPQFRDPANGDYEPKDARLNGGGKDNPAITDDHEGASRGSARLDIGAFNMDCDFGITAFTLPNATECELYTPEIDVTLKNYSAKEYINIPVGVSIDNNDQVNNFAPGSLAASASTNYTYDNSYTFKDAGSYVVRVFPLDDAVTNNDTQSFNITILPAPRGSQLSKGSTFEGLFRDGDLVKFDVTTAGDEVTYDITIPTGGGTFSDANYGSAWSIPARAESESGVVLPSSSITVTAPTSSTDAIVSFIPPAAYIDSILKVVIPVKNLVNGCDSSIVRYVYIAPIPKPNFSAPGVCDGDGIAFTNLTTIESGTLEYEWDFGTNPPAPTTATSPVVKFTKAGKYNVKLTATSNWGYKHDTTIVVEIFEAPDINFRPINACEGTAVQFQNNTTVSSGTISYTWNFGDGSPADMTATPSHTYSAAGEYTVILTAEANGCTRQAKKSAFQFPQPTADFDISGGDCNEQNVEFTNKSTLQFGRLGNLWDFGDNSYSTSENTDHSFTTAGEQSITLKVTSEFGCSDQLTKKVTLKESPIASFDNTQTCDIDPVEFTNTSFIPSGVNVDYTWTFGDPTSGANNTSSLTNPQHKYSLPGARKVTLNAQGDNGCEHTFTKDIVIGVQPQADFTALDGCTDEPIKFDNETTISRGDIEITYDWSFGSNDVSPEHAFTTAGTQSVTLKATAVDGGCTDEITKDIEIGETPSCDFTSNTTGHLDVSFSPVETNPDYDYSWEFGDGGFSDEINPSYTYLFHSVFNVKLRITTPEGCMCENTVLSRKTSVGDVNFAERVSIYPNPSTGVFTIEIDGTLTEDVSIEVYNSLGAVVAVVDVNQSVDGKYIVNLGDVAAGVYTVKFTSSSSVYTQKVTVTK